MLTTNAGNAGLSMNCDENGYATLTAKDMEGRPLKEIALLAKSWDYLEAGYGVAAINAFYNTPENAQALSAAFSPEGLKSNTQTEDAFLCFQKEIVGKKVAVIGHFPYLEERFAPICDLSILERKPAPGDYPDPACEYILPEQDYVFVTGVTLINKTLPRLLELAKKAATVMVGPSVPLAPVLFEYGASSLCGFVVQDINACRQHVMAEASHGLFVSGTMVHAKH